MKVTDELTLLAGNIKRIHVNQFVIKRFHKDGTDEPGWIVRTSNGAYQCRHWTLIDGAPIEGIQSLAKPMPGCNARMWLETHGALLLSGAEKMEDICEIAA